MKKRLVIKSKVRFCTFICIVTLLFTCSFGLITNKTDTSQNVELQTINVQNGDTLWNIAEEYAPVGMDIREYIYNICKINNITANQLSSGMTVMLPADF